MEASFLEGRYGNGSTNEVQRVAREVLARQQLEQQDAGTGRVKPMRSKLDPAMLNPLHGLKGVSQEVEVAQRLDMSAGAVASRIETKQYLAKPVVTSLPSVVLSAAQIEAGGRELKKRISTAIAQETFLRQYNRTIDLMARNRTCVRCRVPFSYIDSVNAWQCRGHSKLHDGQKWLCCGNPLLPSDIYSQRNAWSGHGFGCTPMDHIDLELHELGVLTGDAWWKLPVDLIKMFGTRKFWYPCLTSEVLGSERFAVVWDLRDKQDIEFANRARRLADTGNPNDIDSDDEDRVIVETRVKRSKWATLKEDRDDLRPRCAHYSFSPTELRNFASKLKVEERTRAQEASKKDFVYLPSSPIASGPDWLVGTNRFDLAARGPDVLQQVIRDGRLPGCGPRVV